MSDSRAHIKISMEIYGKKYKTDMSINYWDDGDGNDQRVKEWFANCYAKAYENYSSYNEKRAKDEEEANEREELERLKAKYE